VDLCPRFLVPFLRSIFDPFSDFSLRAICFIYWVFSISMSVLDPFLDLFWDVHLTVVFTFVGVDSRHHREVLTWASCRCCWLG
jgi:hypothetical protein